MGLGGFGGFSMLGLMMGGFLFIVNAISESSLD